MPTGTGRDPQPPGSGVNVIEGADDEHAVTGLTLNRFTIGGESLRDAAVLERVAGLTIGPHVRDVTIA